MRSHFPPAVPQRPAPSCLAAAVPKSQPSAPGSTRSHKWGRGWERGRKGAGEGAGEGGFAGAALAGRGREEEEAACSPGGRYSGSSCHGNCAAVPDAANFEVHPGWNQPKNNNKTLRVLRWIGGIAVQSVGLGSAAALPAPRGPSERRQGQGEVLWGCLKGLKDGSGLPVKY